MAGPFPYIQDPFDPPAPAFDVSVSFRGKSILRRGMIDSGADKTFIPAELVNILQLEQIGEEDFEGATGATETCNLYLVRLEFHGFIFEDFPVYSLRKEDIILIGRDIINNYTTTLDGPRLKFSMD